MAGSSGDDVILRSLISEEAARLGFRPVPASLEGSLSYDDDKLKGLMSSVSPIDAMTGKTRDDAALDRILGPGAGQLGGARFRPMTNADDDAIVSSLMGPRADDDAIVSALMGNPRASDDVIVSSLLGKQIPTQDDVAINRLMKSSAGEMQDAMRIDALMNEGTGSQNDDIALANIMYTGRKSLTGPLPRNRDEAIVLNLMKGAPLTDTEAIDDAVLQKIMQTDAGFDDAALLDLMRTPAHDPVAMEAELRNSREQELLARIAALRRKQSNQLKDEAILEQVIAEAGGMDSRPKAPPPHTAQLLRIRRIRCIKMRTDDLKAGSPQYFASIGDVTSARFLCERARRFDDRFFVNGTDERGCTALHYAAFEGCAEMADVLLQAGADVLLRDKDGRTPLHVAASRGNFDVAKLIVGTGIYRVRAAALRRFKTLRYALETESEEDINVIEEHAAHVAMTEYLRSLEDLRYNLFMTEDRFDYTCVHYAIRDAYHGCMAVLNLMLGAMYEFVDDTQTDNVMRDRRFQPQIGFTLLEFLIGKERISKFHVEEARREHIKRSLAIREELVNGRDPYGLTPLHYASAEGNYRGVHILVQHGADVGAKGVLPKHSAAQNMDSANVAGVTPFELAKDSITRKALAGYSGRADTSLEAHAESIVKLVEGNCEYINNTHGVMSRTPLHATLFGAIEAGVPDRWDREAPPPAVMALLHVHPECDPLVPDASGWTPLHFACAYGRDKELLHLVQRVRVLHPHAKDGGSPTNRKENGRRPSSAQRAVHSKASTGRLDLPTRRKENVADPRKAKMHRNVRSAGVGGGIPDRPADRAGSVGKTEWRGVYGRLETSTTSFDKEAAAFLGAHMGRTPAHLAAQGAGDSAESVILGTNPHLNCLTVLRQFKLLEMEVEDDHGMTPFLAACDKGAAVAVQWLLERGADCYKGDRTKRNGLHLAVARGHRRTIRLLSYFDADQSRLKRGQDWKGRRPEEMSRTMCANSQLVSQEEIADDFATIWEAARDGDIDQLLRALRAGTDVDTLSPAGWTACMYAAEAGHAALLRHLLALKCQCDPPMPPPGGPLGPNVPAAPRISRLQVRPMPAAEKCACGNLLEDDSLFCRRCGAKRPEVRVTTAAPLANRLQVRSAHGCGPLHLAAQKGHPDICSLLVRQGRAQLELRSARNLTPLMYACAGGHLGAVQALVNLRANLELDVDSSKPSRCLFHILAAGKSDGHAACIQWIAGQLDCFVVSEMLERTCDAQDSLIGGMPISPFQIAASNRKTLHALERAKRDARLRADAPPIGQAT